MKLRLLGWALAAGLALPVVAQAQMLQPGLWELTSSNMKIDDQNMPDLSLILGQLQQQMTPQQRAMLEKQGVTMGGKGIRVCLTRPRCSRTPSRCRTRSRVASSR